jgi:hypothetical protein
MHIDHHKLRKKKKNYTKEEKKSRTSHRCGPSVDDVGGDAGQTLASHGMGEV